MFPRDVNKLRYNHQKVILHTIASLLIMSQCEDHVFQTSGSKGTYEKKTFSERYTTLSPARACFTSCSIDPRKHQKQTKQIAPLKSNPPQVQQVYTHCTPLPPPRNWLEQYQCGLREILSNIPVWYNLSGPISCCILGGVSSFCCIQWQDIFCLNTSIVILHHIKVEKQCRVKDFQTLPTMHYWWTRERRFSFPISPATKVQTCEEFIWLYR